MIDIDITKYTESKAQAMKELDEVAAQLNNLFSWLVGEGGIKIVNDNYDELDCHYGLFSVVDEHTLMI